MSITQIILVPFLLFALSRVILRFKSSEITLPGLFLWSGIFGWAAIVVVFPQLTTRIAQTFGIGRGADVVVYISVALLFYLVFRLYVFIQDIRQDITEIVTKLAIRDKLQKKDEKSSKN